MAQCSEPLQRRSRQEVCQRASGGGLLVGGFGVLLDEADAVAIAGAEGDFGEQVRSVESSEGALGDEEQAPTRAVALATFL
jgi:hypothetical protein